MIQFIINYFRRCKIPTKKEIEEYYPRYLLAHRHPTNKLLHLLGNISTYVFISSIVFLSVKTSLLFLPLFVFTPFVVYPFAWLGHFKFEKNVPATFKQNPILTKICDNIMIYQLITKKIPLDSRKP